MNDAALKKDAILRIGEVSEVRGRRITITVDKDKNVSDLFFDGDILKNISVNSYVEIRKGFNSLIGKVDGEKLEDASKLASKKDRDLNRNLRELSVTLVGFIGADDKYEGGTRELPLIGNEAFVLTKEKVENIHTLSSEEVLKLYIAKTDQEKYDISFPVDGLFNSHIAIFGNTGSGKSNSLAILYQELFALLRETDQDKFTENCRYLLFDFNGEYKADSCLTEHKKVFNLSTKTQTGGDKIPLSEESLLDLEVISILADATEKTQKPFLKRVIRLYWHVHSKDDPREYFRNILRKRIEKILTMSDKIKVDQMLDYVQDILPDEMQDVPFDPWEELDWINTRSEATRNGVYLKSNPDQIQYAPVYQHVQNYEFSENFLLNFIDFMYLQLITDVISNRALNEHIAPAINKFKAISGDIGKLFDTTTNTEFWSSNIIVVNLSDVNIDMKKTIPMLLSKKAYADHKEEEGKILTIIIDEAHNILSTQSFREQDSWKDYRLETFEEIIKEGRKFGVFLTISSQRPNDISQTITSQAHNYFIHRLINQKDLTAIANAVSYIDAVMEESIPSLPTGVCIFSGIATQMPMKLQIKRIKNRLAQPASQTITYKSVILPDGN